MKHLAFGPGAMGYFMYLGALSALSDTSALNELQSIAGASAGALLGFVYLLAKGDIQKMLEYSLVVPVKTVMKPNIKVLLKSFGLVSTKKVREVFQDTVRTFTQKDDITFTELYAHMPIKFHVAACCIDLHATHYFSVDTAPSMSVLDAVCMSISIPFLFQSTRYGPWRYIDGGTLESIPCGPYIGYDPKTVLTFGLDDEWKSDVKDLKTYALCILGAALTLRQNYPMFPRIGLLAGEMDIFDFGASHDAKLRMFTSGYAQTKKSLCKVNAYDPACCVHAQSQSQSHQSSCDTQASQLHLPSTGVDRPCFVDHDPEPRSSGSRAQSPADAQGGHARDVGLLDGGVPAGASQSAHECDQQGTPETSVSPASPAAGRDVHEA
jgi:predicted acylesterase/phospholipase RssA